MFSFLKTKKSYEAIAARDLDQFLSDNPAVVILDVRTSAEHKAQSIKGAINIDVLSADFGKKIAKLDQTKAYLLYCRSGSRSASACNVMAANGFTKLYNLSGGIMSYGC